MASKSYTKLSKQHYTKVNNYINNLRQTNLDVNLLLMNLEKFGDLILLGGAIRDIAIFNKNPRDYDIIVDSFSESLEKALQGFTYSVNRFGGYKLQISHYEFDIWSIKNNWAFREKLLETKAENIIKGTFYNVDSLIIKLNDNYYDFDYFNEAIESNKLDIVLEDDVIELNPTPEINVVRALWLKKQWNLDFSDRVKDYIYKWRLRTENPYTALKDAEMKHFGTLSMLNNEDIIHIF